MVKNDNVKPLLLLARIQSGKASELARDASPRLLFKLSNCWQ